MKRGLLILSIGVLGAVVAFCCVYRIGTATPRALMQSSQPELAWLQHKFNLGEAEFKRISDLHAGYLPQCLERCRQIDELNGKLANLLATAPLITIEIESLLKERAQLRANCQLEMLKHFFQVSHTMPAEQGRRYLDWAQENTCLREDRMYRGSDSRGSTMSPAHRP